LKRKSGNFIISLDFELLWGMRDHETIKTYGENISGVRNNLPKILDIFETYGIKATFATVGFLFASNKKDLISMFPKDIPNYFDEKLSPYGDYFKKVKGSENLDKYHFASELIDLIKDYSGHEIASHTFSHYYSLEGGQTTKEFKADLLAAIEIAKKKNIKLKSIVFPRNQINSDYLKICLELGIQSYRGNENAWFYKIECSKKENIKKRFFRLLDSYINISGYNTYSIKDIDGKPYNIHASRFLRPYNPKLEIVDGLKLNRILKSMTYAAKNGEIFHLWWHPHNFGKYQEQNLNFLIKILNFYKLLYQKYNFESITMEELSYKLNKQQGELYI